MSGKLATIPAVAYVRKSTRGKRTDGREKQEKSLPVQREEVLKLAREKGCHILRWYEDEGISGWKRDAARPGFARMLADAREKHDFKAIVVDDMDRFSRADAMDVISDVRDLYKAGVATIHSVKDGDFHIDPTDPGMMHHLVAVVMANHEFSRKLSRRVTRARRNAAKEGKRTGGPAPYGLKDDGAGGLVHGDPRHAEVVRWLFDQVGNKLRSLTWLAGELNRRKVPAPGEGEWFVRTISNLLRRPCYRGDFVFNRNPEGQFFGIDDKGEVVERVRMDGKGHLFRAEGKYEPLVDPALYDRVQDRLAALAQHRGLRKRVGYPLSGILVCGHCGKPMYGMREKKTSTYVVYRCQKDKNLGRGACGFRRVREDVILPFILKKLGEEIQDLTGELTSVPPESLLAPHREREELRKQKEAERGELAADIGLAQKNMLKAKDDRTFKSLEAEVTAMRDRLDQLDAELSVREPNAGFTDADLAALNAWQAAFEARALAVPLEPEYWEGVGGVLHPEDYHEDPATTMLADPLMVNNVLRQLGAEVKLWWNSKQVRTKAGDKTITRHTLERGRFRLGQQQGDVPGVVLKPAACRASTRPSTANWPTPSWPLAPC
jgi:site-specific DNA recombinase